MFVPSTKGGILTKMLRENEPEMIRITKFKVKFQEAGGIKLAGLFSTNLSKGEHCQRQDCVPCNQRVEKRPNCKQAGILYESKCSWCNKEEDQKTSHQEDNQKIRQGIYYGESSRPLYERSREHLNDAVSFRDGSHIDKHWLTSDP
jgi:hypothetical protein